MEMPTSTLTVQRITSCTHSARYGGLPGFAFSLEAQNSEWRGIMTCLAWWYFDEPLYLWRAIVIITKKTYFGFSIGMLLSTLFDPWKKDVVSVENASLDVQFKIILDNLFSRFIGFIMRFFTMIIGLVFTSLVFVTLLTLFLIWILLPVIIVALLYFGIRTVQNG